MQLLSAPLYCLHAANVENGQGASLPTMYTLSVCSEPRAAPLERPCRHALSLKLKWATCFPSNTILFMQPFPENGWPHKLLPIMLDMFSQLRTYWHALHAKNLEIDK